MYTAKAYSHYAKAKAKVKKDQRTNGRDQRKNSNIKENFRFRLVWTDPKAMNTPSGSGSVSSTASGKSPLTCMVSLHLTLQMDPLSISKGQPKRQNFKSAACRFAARCVQILNVQLSVYGLGFPSEGRTTGRIPFKVV